MCEQLYSQDPSKCEDIYLSPLTALNLQFMLNMIKIVLQNYYQLLIHGHKLTKKYHYTAGISLTKNVKHLNNKR